jgi:hypothetical protein
LQSFFDTISAVLIAGVLFFLIGITGILAYLIQIFRNYWAIHTVKPPTVEPLIDIKSANLDSKEDDTLRKYSSVCGEIYTEKSIHDVCIMCGSVITIKN